MSEIKTLNGYALVDEEARKTDPTLTVEGMAADGRAVGDALANTVHITEQTLTPEQQAQVRANIGISDTVTESEILNDIAYTPNSDAIRKWDYSYGVSDSYQSYCGTVFKRGSMEGGLLRCSYDPDAVAFTKPINIGLYLFDSHGNPYKHTGYGDGSGNVYFGDDDTGFIGEMYKPTYAPPNPEGDASTVNAGYSFGDLLGPFSTQIPEGCTVQIFIRNANWPNGNLASAKDMAEWIENGGITFTVSKTYKQDELFQKKNLGPSNANRNLVTDAEGNISVGGTVEEDEEVIPEYWKPHLVEKIAAIKALQAAGGRDCFSFGVISDLHYSENKGKRSPALARYIMDACDIKYLMCLGDMQTQAASSSEDKIREEWHGIRKMFAPLWDRTLMTLGNHDGAWGQLDSNGDGIVDYYYCYNLTPQELYEYVYRKVGMIPGVCFDSSGNGYYIDDNAGHVRYIVLNTSCTEYAENSDGTAVNNYMTKQRLTQSQFDLVIDALNGIPSDSWSVVIGTHIPLIADFSDNYVGDRTLLMSVLTAFQNKTTYSGTYGQSGAWDYVTVNVDFTNAKGNIVGAFAGHIHSDGYNLDNAFPVILTTCDAEPSGDETHELGTTTEQSFDIFTVNRSTGAIYATKIGYGEDRSWTN